MIEQCGVRCDVCGNFILDGDTNPFKMTGFKNTLACHDKCKGTFQAAILTGTWRSLPDGPIRQAFEKAEK